MAEEERTRLHITPFNASLYPVILAPSLQAVATSPSYHGIQSDPGHSYGYITLPAPDAEKLRKKLNGSVLRGAKMRIEVAKPEKRKLVLEAIERDRAAEERGEEQEEPRKKKAKKSRRKDGEIRGFEMPEDRSVKRGWTEDPKVAVAAAAAPRDWRAEKEAAAASKLSGKEFAKAEKKKERRKQEKSKFTTQPEVLFKTSLPLQSAIIAAEDAKKTKKDKKEKKLREKLQSGHGRDKTVIHEFEKNVQFPSFLRQKQGDGKTAVEFDDARGWLDAEGNVVEESKSKGKREDRLAAMPENNIKPPGSDDEDDEAEMTKKAEKKEKKKEKKDKEKHKAVVFETEQDEDVPVQDENTKEQLARFNKMLDDESDSEENFKDAGSESESGKVEEDLEEEGGVEEDMKIEDEDIEDEDMIDAEDVQSSDDAEQVDEMSKEPADRESAKLSKVIDVESPAQPAEKASSSEAEESDESEDLSSSDSEPKSDASQASASDEEEIAPTTTLAAALVSTSATPSPPQEPSVPKEIHPLEALYKRSVAPNPTTGTPSKPTPIKTSFSFFGNDEDNSDIGPEDTYQSLNNYNGFAGDAYEGVPETPYYRRERSAAPTPDTAAIGKRFSFSFAGKNHHSNIEEEEDYQGEEDGGYGFEDEQYNANYEPVVGKKKKVFADEDVDFGAGAEEEAQGGEGEETGFAKWFWENRGDSNRAWKKRRREVMKVGRQRENRRVGRKAV